MNPEHIIITAACGSLDTFEDMELAALNNALTGWGKVVPKNLAYAKALDLHLINEDGTPAHSLLLDALHISVSKRFLGEGQIRG